MAITRGQRALLIPDVKPIGKMHDKHRKLKVTIYPTRDPELVYTIAESTQFLLMGRARAGDVEKIEPRTYYGAVIRRFPNTAVYE